MSLDWSLYRRRLDTERKLEGVEYILMMDELERHNRGIAKMTWDLNKKTKVHLIDEVKGWYEPRVNEIKVDLKKCSKGHLIGILVDLEWGTNLFLSHKWEK